MPFYRIKYVCLCCCLARFPYQMISSSIHDDTTTRADTPVETYFIVNTNKWIRPTFVKQEQLTVQCTRVHPWCFAAFLLLSFFFSPFFFRSLYRRLVSGYLLGIFKLLSWLNLRFSYLYERKRTFLVDMSESNILKFHYLLELIFSYKSCSFLYFFIHCRVPDKEWSFQDGGL